MLSRKLAWQGTFPPSWIPRQLACCPRACWLIRVNVALACSFAILSDPLCAVDRDALPGGRMPRSHCWKTAYPRRTFTHIRGIKTMKKVGIQPLEDPGPTRPATMSTNGNDEHFNRARRINGLPLARAPRPVRHPLTVVDSSATWLKPGARPDRQLKRPDNEGFSEFRRRPLGMREALHHGSQPTQMDGACLRGASGLWSAAFQERGFRCFAAN